MLLGINKIHNLRLIDHLFRNKTTAVVKGLQQLPLQTTSSGTFRKTQPEIQQEQQHKGKRRKRLYQPSTLISICKKKITSKLVTKGMLNTALSELSWPQTLHHWKNKSCIDHDLGPTFPSTWFSVPEFDKRRKRIEPKVWDGTHLLTNWRRAVCEKGTEKLQKEAWARVAKTNKTKLREPMVIDLVDKQDIEFAKTTFSEEVATQMLKLGYTEEAKFCSLISNWWKAEDEPGISAKKRFEFRVAMQNYLMDGVDFGKFPPYGNYIKGILII